MDHQKSTPALTKSISNSKSSAASTAVSSASTTVKAATTTALGGNRIRRTTPTPSSLIANAGPGSPNSNLFKSLLRREGWPKDPQSQQPPTKKKSPSEESGLKEFLNPDETPTLKGFDFFVERYNELLSISQKQEKVIEELRTAKDTAQIEFNKTLNVALEKDTSSQHIKLISKLQEELKEKQNKLDNIQPRFSEQADQLKEARAEVEKLTKALERTQHELELLKKQPQQTAPNVRLPSNNTGLQAPMLPTSTPFTPGFVIRQKPQGAPLTVAKNQPIKALPLQTPIRLLSNNNTSLQAPMLPTSTPHTPAIGIRQKPQGTPLLEKGAWDTIARTIRDLYEKNQQVLGKYKEITVSETGGIYGIMEDNCHFHLYQATKERPFNFVLSDIDHNASDKIVWQRACATIVAFIAQAKQKDTGARAFNISHPNKRVVGALSALALAVQRQAPELLVLGQGATPEDEEVVKWKSTADTFALQFNTTAATPNRPTL